MTCPHINDAYIAEVSQIFDALGDASRLKLLRALLEASEPLHQGALMQLTGLSQANASKHLAYLVRVGVVTREQHGTAAHFCPASSLVSQVFQLVCAHVQARTQSALRALE